MIEEQAVVIKCEAQYVWVETQRQSSCGHCSVKNGCGTQLLSNVLGNKMTHVRCLNPQPANSAEGSQLNPADGSQLKPADGSYQLNPGDRVIIGLQESALLSGSLLLYLLPLVLMILFGAISVFMAKIWWPEGIDFLSVIASFTGLFTGLQFARNYSQNKERQQQFEPVIIKKIPVSESPLIHRFPA